MLVLARLWPRCWQFKATELGKGYVMGKVTWSRDLLQEATYIPILRHIHLLQLEVYLKLISSLTRDKYVKYERFLDELSNNH